MKPIFHPLLRMSIGLMAGAAAFATGAVAQNGSANGSATTSPYYGRWTVSNDRPVFTARGREYRTIDIAPCGNDFCGVSVADNGTCGPRLFRFLGRHANSDEWLRGHGRWGQGKKNVVIYSYDDDSEPPVRTLELYLGDGYDFGERSSNMPKFHANYRRTGEARCTSR